MKQYTVEEFIEGKFAVKVNKNNYESFLEMCAKRCLRWASGEKANEFIHNFDITEPEIAIKCEERCGGNEICLVYGRASVIKKFGTPVVAYEDFMGSNVHPSYQITITCDGNTTTATMTINGREVKTAIARRNPEDKFDWRKGAALAFERLWNSPRKAERKAEKKPEVRAVKRYASLGEYIKIVDAMSDCGENYHNGDILLVEEDYEGGRDGWVKAKGANVIINPDEYVVLEGYRP